jgi:phosphatidylserine/phosphatidylglycerophosphate/cardiolipin synthase-like enzyme
MKLVHTLSLLALGMLLGATLAVFFPTSTTALLSAPTASTPESATAYFCPHEDCPQALIAQIDSAKSTIDIAIYSFTDETIADALIAAQDRGVAVRIAFDSGQAQSQYSVDEALSDAHVPIRRIDKSRGILHDKFAVIDGEFVATGSYNYTNNAAENNNENLLILRDTALAKRYADEFEYVWNQ